MITIELAQGFRRRSLHFEHCLAQRETRWHLGKRAFVGSEASGVQSTHRGEESLVGLDEDAAVVVRRFFLGGLRPLRCDANRVSHEQSGGDRCEFQAQLRELLNLRTPELTNCIRWAGLKRQELQSPGCTCAST